MDRLEWRPMRRTAVLLCALRRLRGSDIRAAPGQPSAGAQRNSPQPSCDGERVGTRSTRGKTHATAGPRHRSRYSLTAGDAPNTMVERQAAADKMAVGEARFLNAGHAHEIRNTGSGPLRVVTVEFSDPQGKHKEVDTSSRYCNPDSTAAASMRSSFSAPRRSASRTSPSRQVRSPPSTAILPITCWLQCRIMKLTDQVEGKGIVVRTRKSGEVEYIPAGITHRITNASLTPARFIVIVWR